MPQKAWTEKRERQYEHIAAATVNRTRTANGETKEPKSATERSTARRKASAASRKAGKR